MNSVSCPRCGAAASGHFCSSCGSSLAALTCPSCAATFSPGARFCPRCGTSLTGDPAGGSRAALGAAAPWRARAEPSVAWWITGASLVALILVIAWPILRPEGGPLGPSAAGTPMAGSPPDLSSMTAIEAADRLFERVMSAVDAGDEATVQRFLPMALQAYEIARPLNADGLYHLATLERAAAGFRGALETAQEGLQAAPDHLLLLAAAGEAAEGLGDMGTARAYWQRFVDVYEIERARQLEEYQAHEFTLQESLTRASEVLGG